MSNDLYTDSEFECNPTYDPKVVAEIKDTLRSRFPYIDEATDAEVIEFAATLTAEEESF